MRTKLILLSLGVLLFSGIVAQVQAQDAISGTLDVKYLTQYMWRGFDMYDGKSAIQPSLDVDLYGTGFGLEVKWARANSDEFENLEWLPITLYYQGACMEDDVFATDYKLGWTYYNFPDNSAADQDLQEGFGRMAWPNLLGVDALVPSYEVYYLTPSSSEAKSVSNAAGWLHGIGLNYYWTVPGITSDMPEQVIDVSAKVYYNDGFADNTFSGVDVDHDYSHAVFGAKTDFALDENLSFTPGLYWQQSMDESVNDEDELWASLGLSYKF